MIFKTEFPPYRKLANQVTDEQINPYILDATNIDLEASFVTIKDYYTNLMTTYNTSKNATITGNVVIVDETASLTGTNYAYLTGVGVAKRVKYTITNATTLTLENNETITSGVLTYFIDYTLFEKIRPFLVYSTWLRYFPEAQIQSTHSGFKQNNIDFSEFLSDATIGRVMQTAKRNMEHYRSKLLDFLNESKCEQELVRTKVAYGIKKQNEYVV